MKKILIKMLICPVCLPDEIGLNGHIVEERAEDILSGTLTCPQCAKTYPIHQGVAFLDPRSSPDITKEDSKYETPQVLSAYIWSHYGDILKESEASDAYDKWADLLNRCSGVAIDAGCAVGRFTFEMSQKSDFAIGIDNSLTFVQCARELMLNRRLTVALKQEGEIVRDATVFLPKAWDSDKVEFIVADAQAMPFRSHTFSALASLNLVDKVPLPVRHLMEINRIAGDKETQFLFSDPFSWSTDVADQKNWLGGTRDGPYAGSGLENVTDFLKGQKDPLKRGWRIEKQGHVWWKIRTHSNHFELIRSCFVKAHR